MCRSRTEDRAEGLVNEAGQLLPQPLEHAALGKQHGVQRQVQRLRDLHSRLAFRDVTTERLPRDRGEIALPWYPLDRFREDVLVVLAVPQAAQGAVGRLQFIEPAQEVAVAGGGRQVLLPAEVVT